MIENNPEGYNPDFYLNYPYACPQCKKPFYIPIPTEWAYKYYTGNRVKMMCSWGCLRKYEKSHPQHHTKISHGITYASKKNPK